MVTNVGLRVREARLQLPSPSLASSVTLQNARCPCELPCKKGYGHYLTGFGEVTLSSWEKPFWAGAPAPVKHPHKCPQEGLGNGELISSTFASSDPSTVPDSVGAPYNGAMFLHCFVGGHLGNTWPWRSTGFLNPKAPPHSPPLLKKAWGMTMQCTPFPLAPPTVQDGRAGFGYSTSPHSKPLWAVNEMLMQSNHTSPLAASFPGRVGPRHWPDVEHQLCYSIPRQLEGTQEGVSGIPGTLCHLLWIYWQTSLQNLEQLPKYQSFWNSVLFNLFLLEFKKWTVFYQWKTKN